VDATVADPVIGRLLDGRYTAQERLAVGGMATVYIAHDSRLDRLVALKVMHQNLIHDPDFVARFHREATAAARLNTPYAVSVLDQGSAHGPAGQVIYLVMELVRGKSLRAHLGARGRLSVPEAMEIMEPVAEALAAAHGAGIIHRDIKPENILLGDDGRVKVADFGLARPVAQPTQALTHGVVMGTVGYLSPEQVTDGSADTRSDVYAAGVVLFELLTGQLPHTGTTPMSVAYQSVHGDVPAPSTLVPGIPPQLDDLVLRSTARDPRRRPADGGALLAELQAVLPYLPDPDGDYDASAPYRPSGTFVLSPGGRPAGDPGYDDRAAGGHPGHPGGGRRSRRQSGGQQPYRRFLPVALAAVVALLLVVGFLLFRPSGDDGGTARGTVAVPSVKGLAKAAAEKALRDAGLKIGYARPAASDTVPENNVVGQVPAQGAEVSAGSTVTLTLSSGQAPVGVPNIEGLSEMDAKTELAAAGLNVSEVKQEANDTVPAGHAVRTEPPSTEKLKPGTDVVLVVSSGSSTVTVPTDLEGIPFAEAQGRLTGLGLAAARRDVDEGGAEPGEVVGVENAGAQVPRGSAVVVYVARGGDDGGRGKRVRVPDVQGRDVGEAQAILREAGLNPEPGGIVIFQKVARQWPGPGDRVDRGSTVRLFLRD
jgi:serine/threonine-protein kinase